MNFSMTLDRSTVSCSNTENMYIVLQHVEACFLAAGYTTETFIEYLSEHLEMEHGMVVMPEKDYHAALDDARADGRHDGAREEEPDCDDSDDGAALASAGWGADEDYGDCGRI